MAVGTLISRFTGQQCGLRPISSAYQQNYRRSEAFESARRLMPECQIPRSGHTIAMKKFVQHTGVDTSTDHMEPCSGLSARTQAMENANQSSGQKDELRIAVLGLCGLTLLHRQQLQPQYKRSSRRWFGLRPGKLVLVEQQAQHLDAVQEMWAGAQRVMPVEAWTAVGGFLLATLLQWVVATFKGRALQRKQREEAQQQALLKAQKASYRHRSRFQRALGSPPAELSAAELDGEKYDGLPEDSFNQPAHREEDFEVDPEEVEREEEEEEPWEYDSEALKHWEQFVKKSKATQVSEANWWDMDASALDDRALPISQEKRDWNA